MGEVERQVIIEYGRNYILLDETNANEIHKTAEIHVPKAPNRPNTKLPPNGQTKWSAIFRREDESMVWIYPQELSMSQSG